MELQFAAMAVSSRNRIGEDTVWKAVKALLKWKQKSQSQSLQQISQEEKDDTDDFMYLSITLKKVPPQHLTISPHRIPLRHFLLPIDSPDLNLCLIVDGKKITHESAQKILKNQGFPFTVQVYKLSKLKSDCRSFDSRKKLYNCFDLFLAAAKVIPLLPHVLGRMFYKKKRKIPVPVDLKPDGSNWKEEIERACSSGLLCLSGGTCSLVRIGRWGVSEEKEIVDNVFEAIDRVLEIVPKKWGGIRCLHLKFSSSLALPIHDSQPTLPPHDHDTEFSLLVGKKRQRNELLEETVRNQGWDAKKKR